MTDASRTLTIDGMSCSHCVRAVREALDGVDGVAVDDVQIGSATVHAAPDRLDAVTAAVEEAGYHVSAVA